MSEEPRRAVISALGLPRDVILGDVLVRLVGRYELFLENYRSLILYTDTLIRLQAKNCRIRICGRGLCIACYQPERMRITGQITALEFEEMM